MTVSISACLNCVVAITDPQPVPDLHPYTEEGEWKGPQILLRPSSCHRYLVCQARLLWMRRRRSTIKVSKSCLSQFQTLRFDSFHIFDALTFIVLSVLLNFSWSIKHLKKVYFTWSRECLEYRRKQQEYQAFACHCFVLWGRFDELVNLLFHFAVSHSTATNNHRYRVSKTLSIKV